MLKRGFINLNFFFDYIENYKVLVIKVWFYYIYILVFIGSLIIKEVFGFKLIVLICLFSFLIIFLLIDSLSL